MGILRAETIQRLFDLGIRKGGAQERALLLILTVSRRFSVQELVPDKERGARITGGRLYPDFLEGALTQNAATSHAVQGRHGGLGLISIDLP